MSDYKCNEHWPDFYDDCAACGAADAWSSANKRIAELEAENAKLRKLQDKLEEVYPVVAAHIKRLTPLEGKADE